MSVFNPTLLMNEELNNQITSIATKLAISAVIKCGKLYNFDGEEAVTRLGLNSVQVKYEKKEPKEQKEPKKTKIEKPAFPLPFNMTINNNCCLGIKNNHGLYTQCESTRIELSEYCKSCMAQSVKNTNGMPDYGNITDRLSVGLMDYRDPKGKGPIHYTKLMQKLNITKEEVLREAENLHIEIDPIHFIEPEIVVKEKGRPKKPNKLIEVDNVTDLFANLGLMVQNENVLNNNVNNITEPIIDAEMDTKKPDEETAHKLAEEKLAKEAEEKLAKEAEEKLAKEAEKAAKEAEKTAKDAEKAAKDAEKTAKEAEKAEKARKIAEEKAAKEAAKEAEKAQKIAEKAAKSSKKTNPKKKKTFSITLPVADQQNTHVVQPDITQMPTIVENTNVSNNNDTEEEEIIEVTVFLYDGEEYLKTVDNLLYKDGEHVGKITKNNEVVFQTESDEESEDEYDSE
jgi:chemotaxis protein histidine kinase CheA